MSIKHVIAASTAAPPSLNFSLLEDIISDWRTPECFEYMQVIVRTFAFLMTSQTRGIPTGSFGFRRRLGIFVSELFKMEGVPVFTLAGRAALFADHIDPQIRSQFSDVDFTLSSNICLPPALDRDGDELAADFENGVPAAFAFAPTTPVTVNRRFVHCSVRGKPDVKLILPHAVVDIPFTKKEHEICSFTTIPDPWMVDQHEEYRLARLKLASPTAARAWLQDWKVDKIRAYNAVGIRANAQRPMPENLEAYLDSQPTMPRSLGVRLWTGSWRRASSPPSATPPVARCCAWRRILTGACTSRLAGRRRA